MANIMKKGNLKAYINLDTLKKDGLYGLGTAAGLKGEIIIEDGDVYTSTVMDGKIVNKTNNVSAAALLVYTNVREWLSIDTTAAINGLEELESFIEQVARHQVLDLTVPFVFRIEPAASSGSFHIIDWKEGVEHTMSNHKQFAVSRSVHNTQVKLLGFYSNQHHGIFTHHSSNMHVHAKTKNKEIGHLDNINLNGRLTVFLSK